MKLVSQANSLPGRVNRVSLVRMKNYVGSAARFFFKTLRTIKGFHSADDVKGDEIFGEFAYLAINGSLLVEWLLKLICIQEGISSPKIHELHTLYEKLNEELQEKIFNVYKEISTKFYEKCKNSLIEREHQLKQEGLSGKDLKKFLVNSKDDFDNLLKISTKVFVEVRYFYEKDFYQQKVSVTFLILLVISLAKIANVDIGKNCVCCLLEFIPDESQRNYSLVSGCYEGFCD